MNNRNLIYDVGLHRGEDTAFYLAKGFRVVAFEADPDLVDYCQEQFADAIREERLTIVSGAIVRPDDNLTGTISFFKNLENSVWGTVVPAWADRNMKLGTQSRQIEVPTVDFRKCLDIYGVPYYLKIDIEGMDQVCLEALLQVEGRPSYISIESEKEDFKKLIAEFDLLTELGYDSFQTVNQAEVKDQAEPIPAREGTFTGRKFDFGASGLFGKDLPKKWYSRRKIIHQYRWIFLGYRLFGDKSRIKYRTPFRQLRPRLEKILRRSIPGWYDTHAQHHSVS